MELFHLNRNPNAIYSRNQTVMHGLEHVYSTRFCNAYKALLSLHEWGKVRSPSFNWPAQSFFHAHWGVCSPLCLGITSHQNPLQHFFTSSFKQVLHSSIWKHCCQTFYHSGMKRYAERLWELSKKCTCRRWPLDSICALVIKLKPWHAGRAVITNPISQHCNSSCLKPSLKTVMWFPDNALYGTQHQGHREEPRMDLEKQKNTQKDTISYYPTLCFVQMRRFFSNTRNTATIPLCNDVNPGTYS